MASTKKIDNMTTENNQKNIVINRVKNFTIVAKNRMKYLYNKYKTMFCQQPLVKNLSKKIKNFSKNCTLHGFFYLYNAHHWIVYATWSIIITMSFILCGYLSHMIWIKYSIDPTFTVVQSTRYSILNIPFPSVTICDTEPVYGPNTKNITMILQKRGYNDTQIAQFYKSFTAVRFSTFELLPDVKKMHKLFQDLGYNFIDLLQEFHKPCEVILVKCTWRSKPYSCSKMFRQLRTFAGYCCQFDVDYFGQFVDNKTIMQAGVSVSEALDITVNGKKVSATGNITDGYLMLYVVNSLNYVTFLHNAITLTPGGFFDINVHVWAIDSSEEVKALDLKNRNCLLDYDPVPLPHFYEGCVTRLVLAKTVDSCHCLPLNISEESVDRYGYVACSIEKINCVYNNIEFAQRDYQNLIPKNMCMRNCDYIKYDTETEYLKQQRYDKSSNMTLTRVSIHYASNTCMKYRREVLYTWDQMLANLGGIFGLCLGGSIISIIEFTFFILDLICTTLKSFRKPRKVKSHVDKKQIFVLTQKDFSSNKGKLGNGKYKFVN